jgi:hypothetical protein
MNCNHLHDRIRFSSQALEQYRIYLQGLRCSKGDFCTYNAVGRCVYGHDCPAGNSCMQTTCSLQHPARVVPQDRHLVRSIGVPEGQTLASLGLINAFAKQNKSDSFSGIFNKPSSTGKAIIEAQCKSSVLYFCRLTSISDTFAVSIIAQTNSFLELSAAWEEEARSPFKHEYVANFYLNMS